MMVISCYVQPPCDNNSYLPCLIRITSLLTHYRQWTALWRKPPTTPKERTCLDSSKFAVCLSVCLSVCLTVCLFVVVVVAILFAAVTISSTPHRESAIHFHNKKVRRQVGPLLNHNVMRFVAIFTSTVLSLL